MIFNTNFDQLVVKFGHRRRPAVGPPLRRPGPGLRPGHRDRRRQHRQRLRRRVRLRQRTRHSTGRRPSSTGRGPAVAATHSGPGTADDRVVDMTLAPDGGVVVTGFTKNPATPRPTTSQRSPTTRTATSVGRRVERDGDSHEAPADLDVDAGGPDRDDRHDRREPEPLRRAVAGHGPTTTPPAALLQTSPESAATASTSSRRKPRPRPGPSSPRPAPRLSLDSTRPARRPGRPRSRSPPKASCPPVRPLRSLGAVTVAGTVTNVFTHSRRLPDDPFRRRRDGTVAPPLRRPVQGETRRRAGGRQQRRGVGAGRRGTTTCPPKRHGRRHRLAAVRGGHEPALIAPSGLDAKAISRSQIRLRWQDHAGTEDGLRIERCPASAARTSCEIADRRP